MRARLPQNILNQINAAVTAYAGYAIGIHSDADRNRLKAEAR
jgi:hypothetical protein